MKKIIPAFFAVALIISHGATAQTYTINTVTTTTSGNEPIGITHDRAGNIYIANFSGNTVQEYSTGGVLTTLAGDGNAATTGDGGAATAAELNGPSAVTLDDSGNIYIAEYFGCVIRKINKNNIINTVAGNTMQGYTGDGAAATAAELNLPLAITIYARNLYIADAENNVIRKVDTTGIITTFAGDGNGNYMGDGGAATAAELNYPAAIAADGYGNIYIGDFSNSVIRKVDFNNIITTFAGNGNYGFSGDGGQATNAKMTACDGIASDAFGTIYFSDDMNDRVRKVDLRGVITTIAGTGTKGYTGDGGEALLAKVNDPDGLAVDDSGYLYIADSDNDAVRKLSPDCRLQLTVTPPAPVSCNNQSVTMTVSGAITYQWSPATGLSTTTGSLTIANPGATTTYQVTATDSTGCFTTTSVVLEVDTPPVISILPNTPAICAGESLLIVAGGGVTYTWSPATGLSATTGDSVLASPTATVTYTVTAIGLGGCTSTTDYIVMVNLPPNRPLITFSVTYDTLFSSAAKGNQWFVNDTPVTGATDSFFVITGLSDKDTFTVQVTNAANGCSSTSDEVYKGETWGIDRLTVNSAQVAIYPNPSNGAITIAATKNIDEVMVTNLLGQLVYQKFSLGTKQFNFELKGEGMYFVAVTSGNETSTGKIMVSK